MKRFAAFLGVSGTLVLLARAAGAAESPSFWIEAHPWTCSQHVAVLARELSLACDAAGATCAVATTEASADRRVFLKCDETKWTVETHDARGARLWSVDVAGDPSDRARSAAVFAVRAETGESLPPPRAADAIAPAPSAPAAPRAEPAADRAPDEPAKKPADVSIAFAPRAAVAVGNLFDDKSIIRDNVGGIAGVAATATWNVEGLRIGPTAGADIGLRYSGRGIQHLFWHAGVVAGWGAPFEPKIFGVVLEAGYAERIMNDVKHSGYVRPAIIVQVMRSSPVRPFLSASYQLMFGGASHSLAGADLGVVWDL